MALNNFEFQVQWSQFAPLSGRPSGQNENAQIHPETDIRNLRMGRNGRSYIIASVDIGIRLIRADCWVVDSSRTPELLKHEQGHYDIMAIGTRGFYNRLLTLSEGSARDLQNFMNDVRENFRTNARDVDRRYDSATNHGINTAVQLTWDRQIAIVKANPQGTLNDLPQATSTP